MPQRHNFRRLLMKLLAVGHSSVVILLTGIEAVDTSTTPAVARRRIAHQRSVWRSDDSICSEVVRANQGCAWPLRIGTVSAYVLISRQEWLSILYGSLTRQYYAYLLYVNFPDAWPSHGVRPAFKIAIPGYQVGKYLFTLIKLCVFVLPLPTSHIDVVIRIQFI